MEEIRQITKNNSTESLMGKLKLFFKRKEFFQSKIAVWLIILSLIANVINWIILAFLTHPVGSKVILHYNVYFGVDNMGGPEGVFMMPAIGLFIFLINSFLAAYLYKKKERIASYILLMAALMIQLNFLVASASIIIINY
jgi:hypothetical protein